MNLCKFRDVLGKPGEGLHWSRIPVLDIALNDVLLTAMIALVTAQLNIRRWPYHFLLWFLLAEILHLLFCVQTKVITSFSGSLP